MAIPSNKEANKGGMKTATTTATAATTTATASSQTSRQVMEEQQQEKTKNHHKNTKNDNNNNHSDHTTSSDHHEDDHADAHASTDATVTTVAIQEALLLKSYHLPGYTYWGDYYQYMTNNHPLFGIWFHHPIHPIGAWMRCATLMGSLLFGLAMTNIIYLAFVFTQHDYNVTYVAVPKTIPSTSNNHTITVVHNTQIDMALNQQIAALTPSAGNIALWTIGSMMNAIYDNIIWSVASWNCGGSAGGDATDHSTILPTKHQYHSHVQRYTSYLKNFLVMFSVLVAIALATFAATIRQAVSSGQINQSNVTVTEATSTSETTIQLIPVQTVNNWEFLIAFVVELGLSLFIYYPIVATILFTGVLGCCGNGKIPIVGGRPRDILLAKEKQQLVTVSTTTTTTTSKEGAIQKEEKNQHTSSMTNNKISKKKEATSQNDQSETRIQV